MSNYTDTQLKRALAKMLPVKTARWDQDYYSYDIGRTYKENLWWIDPSDSRDNTREVRDTELLHLCWTVEEIQTDQEQDDYSVFLQEQCVLHASCWRHHTTWQQRTIALCKVNGVEIV